MQINIGFGINNDYVKYTGCAIASILANAKDEDSYKFFIVNDFISEENKNKLYALNSIKEFEIEYIQANSDDFKNINYHGLLNIAALFRFYLFSLESVDKILYLDSDITVTQDIAPLFSSNIENYYLGAVKDIFAEELAISYRLSPTATYINSGVMLLNLKKLRTINIIEELQNLPEFFKETHWGDQDAINYIFQDKILPLDSRWNAARDTFYPEFGIKAKPAIIHYITDEKPWKINSIAYAKEEYFSYLKFTPWGKDIMPTTNLEHYIKENVFNIFEMQYTQENAEKYKNILEEVRKTVIKYINPLELTQKLLLHKNP